MYQCIYLRYSITSLEGLQTYVIGLNGFTLSMWCLFCSLKYFLNMAAASYYFLITINPLIVFSISSHFRFHEVTYFFIRHSNKDKKDGNDIKE